MSSIDEQRLEKRREFLRSLTQEDRDFIAKYGEETWKKWNNRGWKNGTQKEQGL